MLDLIATNAQIKYKLYSSVYLWQFYVFMVSTIPKNQEENHSQIAPKATKTNMHNGFKGFALPKFRRIYKKLKK